jgi:hypothetical protein
MRRATRTLSECLRQVHPFRDVEGTYYTNLLPKMGDSLSELITKEASYMAAQIGEELSPKKAGVLLMLGLTKTSDMKGLQRYFYEF